MMKYYMEVKGRHLSIFHAILKSIMVKFDHECNSKNHFHEACHRIRDLKPSLLLKACFDGPVTRKLKMSFTCAIFYHSIPVADWDTLGLMLDCCLVIIQSLAMVGI